MTEKEMQEFVMLVATTRLAQKAYHRNRGNDREARAQRLAEALRLEAELDRAVANLLSGESGPKQGGLFPESPAGGENRDRY